MSRDARRPDTEIARELHWLHVPVEHRASHEFPSRCTGYAIAKASMKPIGFESELSGHVRCQGWKISNGIIAHLSLQLLPTRAFEGASREAFGAENLAAEPETPSVRGIAGGDVVAVRAFGSAEVGPLALGEPICDEAAIDPAVTKHLKDRGRVEPARRALWPQVVRMTAPSVAGRIAHQFGANGIEMGIPDELQKVGILLAEHGLIAVAEEVPGAPVSEVEGDAVTGQQPLHAVAKRGSLPAHYEVEVVAHQDECEEAEVFLLDHAGKAVQEVVPVAIGAEEVTPLHSARDHVVEAVRNIDAGTSRHVALHLFPAFDGRQRCWVGADLSEGSA